MFPIIPANSVTAASENDEGIFGFGTTNAPTVQVSMTNLISNTGVVATDTAGVGTARGFLGACEYGGDKGIFGYGTSGGGVQVSVTNLVSNAGVVASDVAGVGTARQQCTACSYGGDKGIFGYGYWDSPAHVVSLTNLVSNAGVVASDVAGVGTTKQHLAACEYGGDKGIFGFGRAGYAPATTVSTTNLVSNAGVVASDTAGVGTARFGTGATQYGGDKGIFGYGCAAWSVDSSMTNLVSNVGVVASDVAGVGTARQAPEGCSFN